MRALLCSLTLLALSGCFRTPESVVQERAFTREELDVYRASLHGLLLETPSPETEEETPSSIQPASQTDLVLIIDEACTVCSAAIAQALELSGHRRVMIAPVAFGAQETAQFESQVWTANGQVFLESGQTLVPAWVGTDGCGRPVRITGVLLAPDMDRLLSCT